LARSPPDRVSGIWSAAFDGSPNEPRSALRSRSVANTVSLTLSSVVSDRSIYSCSWAK